MVFKESLVLALVGAFCLTFGGCAYNGPAAPSFAAMPGPHKSYESFQGDDQYCQTSAQQAIGYQSPGHRMTLRLVALSLVPHSALLQVLHLDRWRDMWGQAQQLALVLV